MTPDYWQQQTNKPLFPKLVWSRPETKQGAGKLLIIGGQAQEFSHVAESYTEAEKAGAGHIRVFMPESTRKVTKMLPNIEYATSNTSGSFARESLSEFLRAANWADAVLLAGNLGRNSETSLMLENFINKYNGLLAIAAAALPSLTISASKLFKRENTILILEFKDIQKFGTELGRVQPLTSSTTNAAFAKWLHELTLEFRIHLGISHSNQLWTAGEGKVATTSPKKEKTAMSLAAASTVWSMQNSNKIFESVTTAVFC